MTSRPSSAIVLFDGDCGLCSRTVHFIARRDPQQIFRFASLTSSVGKRLLADTSAPQDGSTIVLLETGRAYVRSAAVLRILAKLSIPWRLCLLFWVVPRPMRDAVYRIVARYRHRLGHRTNACSVPNETGRLPWVSEEDLV